MKKRIIWNVIVCFCCLLSCTPDKGHDDKYSPLIHFSAFENWTGEPAGLLYENGEYHLFYQYNPEQPVLGNIHWGHAVSRDLLHWEQLPVAISPDVSGQIYPGSVISDLNNTSGLASGSEPLWIAFYTYHNPDKGMNPGRRIALAYSTDKGLSWKKHATPVIESNDDEMVFRNPHVSWDQQNNRWLMTVSVGSEIRLYSSPDCLQWSLLSEFRTEQYTEGGWESSDLFPLSMAGSDSCKWVLLVSMSGGPAGGAPAVRYFIGDFDGKTFTSTQTQELWTDYGKDNYAGMTCYDSSSGRRILISWMNSWEYANLAPAATRRGRMTFPRVLSLVPEGRYYLLTSSPVQELTSLYDVADSVENIKVANERIEPANGILPSAPFVVRLSFDNSGRHAIWAARDYGIRMKTKSGKSLAIGYKADMNYFYVDRGGLTAQPFSDSFEQQTGATYTFPDPVSDWFILADNGSVELFACGNRIAMTSLCYPDEAFDSFELYAESGTVQVLNVSVIELNKPTNSKLNNK